MKIESISNKLFDMPIMYRNFGSREYEENIILVNSNERTTPGYPSQDTLSEKLLIKLRNRNIDCSYPAYCSTGQGTWIGNPLNTSWIVVPKYDFQAWQHPNIKDLINLTQNKLYEIIKASDKPYTLKALLMRSNEAKFHDIKDTDILDIDIYKLGIAFNDQHDLYINDLFQNNLNLFNYILDIIKNGYTCVSKKHHKSELLLYCNQYYLVKVSAINKVYGNLENLDYHTLLKYCKKI